MSRRTLPYVLTAVLAPFVWTWAFVLFMHVRATRYGRHTGRGLPKHSLAAQGAVWWREVRALLAVQTAQLGLGTAHRLWTPAPVTGPPVLCIHGFTQNGSNFVRLRRHLHAQGRPTEAVLLGVPPRALQAYAASLESHLERFIDTSPTPVDLVAHSMGGVVLRMVLCRRPDLLHRVRRVVTLGSPHKGTGAARGIPLPETRGMGRRSRELATLPMLSELVGEGAVTTIGGEDDTTVYPIESTLDPGAAQVRLPGLGHAGILWDDAAIHTVCSALGVSALS